MGLKATTLVFGSGGSAAVLTRTPTWIDFDFSFDFFQTDATTLNTSFYSLPAGGRITGASLEHSIAFLGGAIATVEASVGIAGSLERILPLFDVNQAVSGTVLEPTNIGDYINKSAATALFIQMNCTGAELLELTQGQLRVSLLLSKAV